MKKYEIPQFLPKDRKFRDWTKQLINEAASIDDVKAALVRITDKLIQERNLDRDKIENNIGVIRGTATPNNWLKYTDFRIMGLTAPVGWTLSGAGGTISIQNGRTGGNTLNKAVRIAAGAGNSVKLTQSMEFFPGELCSLAGWIKPVAGTGRVRIVTTGAATNLGKPIEFDVADWTTFRPFPTQQLKEGWYKIPTDAATCTCELEADASSTLDYCELQFGPGPAREPHLWTPGHDDGQNTDSYTPTGTGVLNIDNVIPGTFYYAKVLDQVIVWGQVTVDATAAGATQYRLSLPIPSSIGEAGDAIGNTVAATGENSVGCVTGVAATDDVLVALAALDGVQRLYNVNFSYRII